MGRFDQPLYAPLLKTKHSITPRRTSLERVSGCPEKCTDLNDYLTRFDFVLTCLQTAEALQAAAYDVISQAAEDGVAYIEVRFAPSQHTEKAYGYLKS